MKIITFSTQKGGTGKTTCSLGFIYKLEKLKKKVLAIDLDSQGNLTRALNVSNEKGGSLEVLTGNEELNDIIVKKNDYINVLPYSMKLSVADKHLDMIGKELRLKEVLEKVKDEYEYCVIDTPPALTIIVVNAYVASNYVILPVKSDDYFSLDSITNVISTINSIKKYWNPELELMGFVINEYNQRSVFSRQLLEAIEKLAKDYNTIVFNSKISKGIAIAENKAIKENIFLNNNSNKAISTLEEFTEEIIKKIKK